MPEVTKRIKPVWLLAAAMLASAITLLVFGAGLTFFQDTWAFLLHRRGLSIETFLLPHNEHIVVAPVAIQKALIEVFGMESAVPERLVLIGSLLITAGMLYLYARPRLGEWSALIVAVLLLFLGSAWQVLLWPFEYSLVGAVAAGLAMLVALDRGDTKGDVWACIALAVSFAFASLGLAFAVAAALDIWAKRRSRGFNRVYLLLIPVALYGAWFLGYGREAERSFSARNIADAPQYVLDSLAAATAALLGLGQPMSEFGNINLDWGRPVLVVFIALLVYSQVRRPALAPRSYAGLGASLAYFAMTALNAMPGREPTSNRYLHMSAAFALILGICLMDGRKLPPRATVIAGLVAALAAVANLGALHDGRAWMMAQSELTRGNLGALEIARDTVADHFRLMPDVAGTGSLIDIEAAAYFSAADAYGTPAYKEMELKEAAPHARYQADVVLTAALPVQHRTDLDGGKAPSGNRCITFPVGDAEELPISPGVVTISVPPGEPYSVRMRRFADPGTYPFEIAPIAAGSTTTLEIPADLGESDWLLSVGSAQPATACTAP